MIGEIMQLNYKKIYANINAPGKNAFTFVATHIKPHVMPYFVISIV